MKKIKAFTLIELLVVIAIIGILATVVIINVSGARGKAASAAALAAMNNVQKIASMCIVDGGFPNLIIDLSGMGEEGAYIRQGDPICCTNQPDVDTSFACNPLAKVAGNYPDLTKYKGQKGPWKFDNMSSVALSKNAFTVAACSGVDAPDSCDPRFPQDNITCTEKGCKKSW